VGSIVFPGYESLFLAREAGLLEERQVRLIELLANTDTLRALAAGQLEAAALTLD
jgi:NitT/TauT family transport system substrate-binding protein